jgi:hypothetical protein
MHVFSRVILLFGAYSTPWRRACLPGHLEERTERACAVRDVLQRVAQLLELLLCTLKGRGDVVLVEDLIVEVTLVRLPEPVQHRAVTETLETIHHGIRVHDDVGLGRLIGVQGLLHLLHDHGVVLITRLGEACNECRLLRLCSRLAVLEWAELLLLHLAKIACPLNRNHDLRLLLAILHHRIGRLLSTGLRSGLGLCLVSRTRTRSLCGLGHCLGLVRGLSRRHFVTCFDTSSS